MPELPHSGNAALGRSIGTRRLTFISPSPRIIPSIARAPFPRALAFPTVLFWNDHPGARTNARAIILPIDIAISTLMMAFTAILPSDDRGSPTALAASTGCSECVNSRVHPIFQGTHSPHSVRASSTHGTSFHQAGFHRPPAGNIPLPSISHFFPTYRRLPTQPAVL